MFLFYHIQQCLTPTWTSIPSHPYTNSTKVLHPTCNQILACLLWALLVKILTIFADARSHIFHQFLVLDRGHPTSGLLPFCCCAKSELGDLQNLPGWWGRSPQAGPGEKPPGRTLPVTDSRRTSTGTVQFSLHGRTTGSSDDHLMKVFSLKTSLA